MEQFWIRLFVVLVVISLLPFLALTGVTIAIIALVEKIKFGTSFGELMDESGLGVIIADSAADVVSIWKYGYPVQPEDDEDEDQ